MLKQQHILLSAVISSPLVLSLIFSQKPELIFLALVFFCCVIFGTSIPDLDSGVGKGLGRTYSKFINNIIITLFPIVTAVFERISYDKNWEHDIQLKHRGIMHSPIGTMASTSIISLIPLILVALIMTTGLASPSLLILVMVIFIGILFGQFLHMLEDSCTVSGINWKFPFGTKVIRGSISTGESFIRIWFLAGLYIFITFFAIKFVTLFIIPWSLAVIGSLSLVILEILFMLVFCGVKF